MQGRTGVSALTPANMIFGPGEIWLNVDEAVLAAAAAVDSDPWTDATVANGAIKLGATRGGSSFSVGRSMRQMPADGMLGTAKGFVRRASVQPTISTNLLELTVENFLNAIAGAVQETAGEYEMVSGGPILEASYLTNVALAATFTGQTGVDAIPLVVLIRNALVYDSPEFPLNDQDEAVLAVTFTGHFDAADPYAEPWAVYHPGATVV